MPIHQIEVADIYRPILVVTIIKIEAVVISVHVSYAPSEKPLIYQLVTLKLSVEILIELLEVFHVVHFLQVDI